MYKNKLYLCIFKTSICIVTETKNEKIKKTIRKHIRRILNVLKIKRPYIHIRICKCSVAMNIINIHISVPYRTYCHISNLNAIHTSLFRILKKPIH